MISYLKLHNTATAVSNSVLHLPLIYLTLLRSDSVLYVI